jgi:hypothetical protein
MKTVRTDRHLWEDNIKIDLKEIWREVCSKFIWLMIRSHEQIHDTSGLNWGTTSFSVRNLIHGIYWLWLSVEWKAPNSCVGPCFGARRFITVFRSLLQSVLYNGKLISSPTAMSRASLVRVQEILEPPSTGWNSYAGCTSTSWQNSSILWRYGKFMNWPLIPQFTWAECLKGASWPVLRGRPKGSRD